VIESESGNSKNLIEKSRESKFLIESLSTQDTLKHSKASRTLRTTNATDRKQEFHSPATPSVGTCSFKKILNKTNFGELETEEDTLRAQRRSLKIFFREKMQNFS